MRSKWMIVKLSDRHRFCDGRLAVFHRVGRDAVHLIDCNKKAAGGELSLESRVDRNQSRRRRWISYRPCLFWQCSSLDLALDIASAR